MMTEGPSAAGCILRYWKLEERQNEVSQKTDFNIACDACGGESSCIAIWVPIPQDQALSGFLWYNNDGAVAFPEVLMESGTPGQPVSLADAQIVGEGVQGTSSGWSEFSLAEPVACLSNGLYVLFRVPEGSEYLGDGAGGGAALGYRADGGGFHSWISADGQDWVAFGGDLGFAFQPQFVDAGEATVVMQGAQRSPADRSTEGISGPFLGAAPNPFNPETKIRFNLEKPGHVSLAIYDVRGQLVRRLVDGAKTAGSHEVSWHGRDGSGRGVASGVYFARLQSEGIVMTQRLVLVQ